MERRGLAVISAAVGTVWVLPAIMEGAGAETLLEPGGLPRSFPLLPAFALALSFLFPRS